MSHDPSLYPSLAARNRLVTGLSKISLALKNQSWKGAGEQGLSPTQGQILTLLTQRPHKPSEIAEALGVKLPTISDAVRVLEDKGLIAKNRSQSDARSVVVSLTQSGHQQAQQASEWPDFLLAAVDTLSETEQAALLRSLVKMIYALQQRSLIATSRMCLNCVFFRPNAHTNTALPHHCDFIQKPFGDLELQLDCPDHQGASNEQIERNWAGFGG